MFPLRAKYDEVTEKEVVLIGQIAVYQSVEKSERSGM